MEVEPCPEDDRRREQECEPLPAFELERRHHCEHDERGRESRRDDEPTPERIHAVRSLGRRQVTTGTRSNQ